MSGTYSPSAKPEVAAPSLPAQTSGEENASGVEPRSQRAPKKGLGPTLLISLPSRPLGLGPQFGGDLETYEFDKLSPGRLHEGPAQAGRSRKLRLSTPSSCSSTRHIGDADPFHSGSGQYIASPGTPLPQREDLKLIEGDVRVVVFDFDGTLTSVPGEKAERRLKRADLISRAPRLAPFLQAIQDSGITMGVVSRSHEDTVRRALEDAGLAGFFLGPVVGRAIDKAISIEELVEGGQFPDLQEEEMHRILLVDDDVRALHRACARGLQTYPAPEDGGLRDGDCNEILGLLGLAPQEPRR